MKRQGHSSFLASFLSSLAVSQGVATNVNVNFLNASLECSHNDKEWRICTQPDGSRPKFYCPAYSDYNETELQTVEPLLSCFSCPSSNSSCADVVNEVNEFLSADGIANNYDIKAACETLCESKNEGDVCSQSSQCTPGKLFCDYDMGDTAFSENGTCRKCPADPKVCGEFATSEKGRQNCLDCRLFCNGTSVSKLFIDGEVIVSKPIDSAVQASYQTANGDLHNCSMLPFNTKSICPGAGGKICLIDKQSSYSYQLSNQAEKSGCVGVVAFDSIDDVYPHSNSDSQLLIPYVYIGKEDGLNLQNRIGSATQIQVNVFGAGCYPSFESNRCNQQSRCEQGSYCLFHNAPDSENNMYTEGHCRLCPIRFDEPDPMDCIYFPSQDSPNTPPYFMEKHETLTLKQNIQSCMKSCGYKAPDTGSKFSASSLTAQDRAEMVSSQSDDYCIVCPNNEMRHPNRTIAVAEGRYQCWQAKQFSDVMRFPPNWSNCEVFRALTSICGCDGQGYAGTTTELQRAILTWLPRVAAILSILGSAFIVFDTVRDMTRRSKFMNQLLSALSVFDIIGAAAYSLTTLPTPQSLYLYGSKGNDATCTAQAFFIQIGTIACYLSVSLSIYYLLTIKYGWSNSKLKKKNAAYYLYTPPIVIGLIFAFVGIPYYSSLVVSCGYSARWWPEVPVIISIASITAIMGVVCFDVYKKERATSQYTGGNNRLSKIVFQQALWFVGAFYVSWVPYLMMQYLWSSGSGFSNYGLILAGSTLLPLQGFWNGVVYIRPRYSRIREETTIRFTSSNARSTMFARRSTGASHTNTVSNNNIDTAPSQTHAEHVNQNKNVTPPKQHEDA